MDLQAIIDRAVNMATRAALNGTPIERVIWWPPTSATINPSGNFAAQYARPMKGSEMAPWDK